MSIPELACRTRADFTQRYADSGVLVLGSHFGGPVGGHLEGTADGIRFRF